MFILVRLLLEKVIKKPNVMSQTWWSIFSPRSQLDFKRFLDYHICLFYFCRSAHITVWTINKRNEIPEQENATLQLFFTTFLLTLCVLFPAVPNCVPYISDTVHIIKLPWVSQIECLNFRRSAHYVNIREQSQQHLEGSERSAEASDGE